MSGQQIVEEPFFPILTSSSPIMRGLENGLPQLLGYNGTTAKPAAQTVLVTARDDPLLAQWQYGLGRSVAWTSDSTGRWAKDWLAWSGFNRFFSQLVSWTFPGEETDGIEARFDSKGGSTSLHVESVEADGSPRDFYSTHATVVGPDLEPLNVDLVQVAPGVYEAPLGEIDSGAYALRVTQTRPGSSALGRTIGLVAPTAAEYRLLGADEPFLAALRSATGGGVVETALDPWNHDLTATNQYTDLWPLLLLVALLLWPLDIALRRVSIGRRELGVAREWIAGARRRRGSTAPRTATGEGLFAARERASGAPSRAALRPAPTEVAPTTTPAPAQVAPTKAVTSDPKPVDHAEAGTGRRASGRTARGDPPARADPSGRGPVRHDGPSPRRQATRPRTLTLRCTQNPARRDGAPGASLRRDVPRSLSPGPARPAHERVSRWRLRRHLELTARAHARRLPGPRDPARPARRRHRQRRSPAMRAATIRS